MCSTIFLKIQIKYTNVFLSYYSNSYVHTIIVRNWMHDNKEIILCNRIYFDISNYYDEIICISVFKNIPLQ